MILPSVRPPGLSEARRNYCADTVKQAKPCSAAFCRTSWSGLFASQQFDYTDEEIVQALYVAAGVGGVIAHRASISGAAGGCQAEIGSASAMAASALVFLQGGFAMQIVDASALALKGLLGLVCDPICGLVEVPCVKRNVIGAVNAVSCAEMALAGIQSRIPADQVFDAMGKIGRQMPASLRETALGGLAATPTAKEIEERLKKKP